LRKTRFSFHHRSIKKIALIPIDNFQVKKETKEMKKTTKRRILKCIWQGIIDCIIWLTSLQLNSRKRTEMLTKNHKSCYDLLTTPKEYANFIC
jgi:hypothetical protein